MSIQTEKWSIILSNWSGLKTDRDSDDIPDGYSPDLLNVRITGSHFRGALGYEIIGTRNNNSGEITSQYTYNRNDGKQVMVRVRDNGTNGTLQWWDATNEEWYILLNGTLTTGKIMDFVEFNTTTTNRMIFCNGVENMSLWTGSTTRLTASVTAGATSIPVVSTADFPATGTIIYNGTEIAYTSKTATAFTVGSAHASAGSNDGVAEAADDSTNSGVTKGNILLAAKDRLWIAGQPNRGNSIDASDEGAPFTFTGGAQRTDSFTEEVLNIGDINGLAEKGDEVIFLGKHGAVGFSFVFPTSTTKAPIYREIFRAIDQGCINPKSVFKVNDEVYFANKNGIQAISDLEGSEKIGNKSITRGILPILKNYDFTDCSAIYYDKENILLFSVKTDDSLAGNDVVIGLDFYKQTDENGIEQNTFGIVKFDWPVNDWAILADKLYFGSSLEMNSHQAFTTYQNDGSPRNIKYATKRFNLKDPFQAKSSDLIAVRGFIKEGTDINVDILLNAGFKATLNKTIESTGVYVSSQILNTIGAFQLGTNPIGATISEVSDLKEFLVYLNIGVDYDWQDIQVIFSSDTDGGQFLITHVGFAADYVGFASIDKFTI